MSALLISLLLSTAPAAPAGDFSAALQRAQRLKGAKARRACRGLRRRARGEGERARAWAFCGRVEAKAKHYAKAARHYRAAAQQAMQDAPARQRYLKARRHAAKKAKDKAQLARVDAVRRADRQLKRIGQQTCRGAKANLKVLAQLEAVYRADHDRGRTSRTQGLQALLLSCGPRAAEAQASAQRVSREARDRLARGYALRALVRASIQAGQPAQALAPVLRLEQQRDPGGRYASASLRRVCAQVDAAEGQGACARHQLKHGGRVRLLRFSSRKRQARRPASTLAEVHALALPALQACVLKAAQADPDRFMDSALSINWAIDRDGQPTNIEVRPHRYAADLAGCLDQTVRPIRYPPIQSRERQNVSIPYNLN